ncbi:hypothetical protein [Streptomyces fragilis]|uniref:Integral membrane protein n=1 Tax=Streptomyces fragilis TaxID=67301 RepID=A0ABV2YM56_9ACTN|nr:hypothetical protein [Streptomyces fragilis]
MFFLAAPASVLIGLLLAYAAVHRLPHRLPPAGMVLPTGVAGALLGTLVTHAAIAPSRVAPLLLGAAALSAAALSLLLRPQHTGPRRSPARPPAA